MSRKPQENRKQKADSLKLSELPTAKDVKIISEDSKLKTNFLLQVYSLETY